MIDSTEGLECVRRRRYEVLDCCLVPAIGLCGVQPSRAPVLPIPHMKNASLKHRIKRYRPTSNLPPMLWMAESRGAGLCNNRPFVECLVPSSSSSSFRPMGRYQPQHRTEPCPSPLYPPCLNKCHDESADWLCSRALGYRQKGDSLSSCSSALQRKEKNDQ